jgi:hypothetical protein
VKACEGELSEARRRLDAKDADVNEAEREIIAAGAATPALLAEVAALHVAVARDRRSIEILDSSVRAIRAELDRVAEVAKALG